MTLPSLIFWLVFALPLVGILVYIMRQDKRKGASGLVVLAIIVVIAVVYMYWRTHGK